MIKIINEENIDINQKVDIKMLLPYQTDGRPLAPLNYPIWLRNTKGFNDVIIDFIKLTDKNKVVEFDEYDSFIYINNNTPMRKKEFLRYDIKEDVLQLCKHHTIVTDSDYEGFEDEDEDEDEYRPHLANIVNPTIKDLIYFCENENIEITLKRVPDFNNKNYC